MQLLVNAQAQDGLGRFAKTHFGSAAIGTIAKLDDAVAACVGGLRVHAIALHEGEAGKVIGREIVFVGHLQDFVVHVLLFHFGNKTSSHSAV